MAIDPNESRKRRMEANYLISLEDPGRFAPQTRQTLATFAANAGLDLSKRLRDHEMAMLQQQGQNAIALEQAHAATLRGQGAEAAEINAGATKYKADADKETAMKQWEVEAAKAKGQFGYFDDTGKYVPGSSVKATELQTQATLENARLERESRIKAAELQGQWHRDVAATTARGRVDAAGKSAEATLAKAAVRTTESDQRAFDTWLNKLDDLNKSGNMPAEEVSKIRAMTPEQQKLYWMRITGRASN